MKVLSVAVSVASLLGATSAFSIPQFEQFAVDSGLALAGLNGIALLNSATKYGGSCNIGNVKIRREWYVLPRRHGGNSGLDR
jgi:tyrosinase